jgi:SNF2 family DNA or RNA helicase
MNNTLSQAFNRAKKDIKGRLDGHCQYEGVKWMLNKEFSSNVKGGILADEVGLGKTMQSIATMRGNPQPTLIVTMVSLVGQWRDELIRFGGYKPIIVNASFRDALPIENDRDTVIITPYSSFQKSIGNTPECLVTTVWGRIILDEGHTIRNKQTKVFKEISKLNTSIRWILSGTPIQNDVKELWALAEWIGVKNSGDVDSFCQEYVLRRTQAKEAKTTPRLALPPLDTQVKYLSFQHKEESDLYLSVEAHYEDKMIEMSSKSKNYNIVMEAIIRCRQICTHPQIYFDGVDKKYTKSSRKRKYALDEDMEFESHGFDKRIPGLKYFEKLNQIPSTKVDFLCNDIQQNIIGVDHAKCLVFCSWTLEMRLIQKELKQRKISSLVFDGSLSIGNKENVLYNFKNTKIPVLLLQINCGSTGLNLQCASRIYIMSPHWNPCIELQAIGRSYRKGQTSKVTCVRLIMEGTIEERCLAIQNKKMALIGTMMMDESMEDKLGSKNEDELSNDDIKTLFGKRGDEQQQQSKPQQSKPQKLRIKLKNTKALKQQKPDPAPLPPPRNESFHSIDLGIINLDELDQALGLDKDSEDLFWSQLNDLPCLQLPTVQYDHVDNGKDMYSESFAL